MKIFQNSVNRYHSLSLNKYSTFYEKIDRQFKHVQFSYKGSFDDINLSFINEYIEKAVSENEGSRTNLFRIFVELAQNIAQKSIDKINIQGQFIGVGILLIHQADTYFEIISGNPASVSDAQIIANKCEIINALSFEELRQMKRNYRKMNEGEMGNANIGLIKIALISGSKLNYTIETIDSESTFFTVRIITNK
jgi:hypothetical protein